MLSRANRLKKQRDFGMVYNRGRSFVSDLFVMYALQTRAGGPRCGFSVSKKVCKACARNLIKRRASEILRPRIGSLKAGTSLIFVARKEAAGADYRRLEDCIDSLLRKAGLLD